MGRIYLRYELTVSANAQCSGTWDSNANSSALLEVRDDGIIVGGDSVGILW